MFKLDPRLRGDDNPHRPIDNIMTYTWLKTNDGSYTLYRKDLDEIYHSRSGALEECQHVYLMPFLKHSPLSKNAHWDVLDVGFGLGYNWLTYVSHQSKTKTPVSLSITSIEKDESILNLELNKDHLGYFNNNDIYDLLLEYKKSKKLNKDHLKSQLIVGDLKNEIKNLADQNKTFDVILHDPFAPQKNPECWDEETFCLYQQIAKPKTALLTYSVASHVRKKLALAGFKVNKIPGMGSKREQLIAFYEK